MPQVKDYVEAINVTAETDSQLREELLWPRKRPGFDDFLLQWSMGRLDLKDKEYGFGDLSVKERLLVIYQLTRICRDLQARLQLNRSAFKNSVESAAYQPDKYVKVSNSVKKIVLEAHERCMEGAWQSIELFTQNMKRLNAAELILSLLSGDSGSSTDSMDQVLEKAIDELSLEDRDTTPW